MAAILEELARVRDEAVPADELARSKRYLGGRLELRMEETRNVSSWIGGQEALHDRVLTIDQALAELEAVTSEGIHSLAQRLISDDGLRMAVVAPPRRGRRFESLLRLPGGVA